MYEKYIIFSFSENIMHHFRKSKMLFISLKFCVFQCPNCVCIHNKIYWIPVTYLPSQIYFLTQSKDCCVPNMNGFVNRLLKIGPCTYFSNARRICPVYGRLYINIETIINWSGAQNPTKSEDVDKPVHPCSLISLSFHWSVASVHGYQIERSEGSDQSVWLRIDQSACWFSLVTEERYVWRYNEDRWRHSIYLRGSACWSESLWRACYFIGCTGLQLIL